MCAVRTCLGAGASIELDRGSAVVSRLCEASWRSAEDWSSRSIARISVEGKEVPA